MKTIFLAVFAFTFLVSSQQAMAQGACAAVHNGLTGRASTKQQIADLLAKGEAQPDKNAVALPADAVASIEKFELPLYENRLLQLLQNGSGSLTPGRLRRLYQSLYFPKELIDPRLEMAKNITKKNIMAVLGDLSLAETLRLTVGPNPEEISPDSLLGRYMAETGVKIQKRRYQEMAGQVYDPVTRAYRQLPPGKIGPERLLAPVDAATLPIFLKYFGNQIAYSAQGHGNLVFNGQVYRNGANSLAPLGMLHEGTVLPWVILKTTEGQRMDRFIQAAMKFPGWNSIVRSPWMHNIKTADGQPYTSANPSYQCCTRYNGDIPVGDARVRTMVFPGPGDKPITAQLRRPVYNDPNVEGVKDIWTYPGAQPISAVLGLAKNNGKGEFASPGWVIQSLLVSTTTERVPVVFWFKQDAKVEIPENAVPAFEAPR